VAVLLLSLPAAGVLTPAAGWADDIRVVAVPTNGAVLVQPPREIVLDFDSAPQTDTSHVSVWDPAQASVTTGELSRTAGNRLRQPLAITGVGDFTVAYHVEFTDGGVATGVLRFSVGTGIAPAPIDAGARQAALASVTAHPHEIDGLSAALLIADGLVLVGAMVLLLRRRAPNRKPMWLNEDDF
jgi:methionine-rich copper-binding protein CopC